MPLFQRWKAIRCTGRDKRGRPCTHIHLEVQANAPKLYYRFRCKSCGSWNTIEA